VWLRDDLRPVSLAQMHAQGPLWHHHRMMKSGLVKTNMLLPPLTMSMTTPSDPSLRRCRGQWTIGNGGSRSLFLSLPRRCSDLLEGSHMSPRPARRRSSRTLHNKIRTDSSRHKFAQSRSYDCFVGSGPDCKRASLHSQNTKSQACAVAQRVRSQLVLS
jgi:hypothetical protein